MLFCPNAGGDIIISVSDDGRGLDPGCDFWKAKISLQKLKYHSHKEILNLIMMPDSPLKKLSVSIQAEVGMDVVKKNIEKIGAPLPESIKGEGTSIIFKIPLLRHYSKYGN